MSSMTGNSGYGGGGTGSPMVSGYGKAGNKIPKGYKYGQIQNYTPEQMQLLNQGIQNLGPQSYLSRLAGGDQSLFEEMEAPAYRQFEELQGMNASRFSGMGLGARHGSGFQNAQSAATSNFAQDLAARRQELQGNAIRDLHTMSQQLLGNRPYEQFLTEKQQNPWVDIAGKFAGAIPGAIVSYATGGASNAGNALQQGTNSSLSAWAPNSASMAANGYR